MVRFTTWPVLERGCCDICVEILHFYYDASKNKGGGGEDNLALQGSPPQKYSKAGSGAAADAAVERLLWTSLCCLLPERPPRSPRSPAGASSYFSFVHRETQRSRRRTGPAAQESVGTNYFPLSVQGQAAGPTVPRRRHQPPRCTSRHTASPQSVNFALSPPLTFSAISLDPSCI